MTKVTDQQADRLTEIFASAQDETEAIGLLIVAVMGLLGTVDEELIDIFIAKLEEAKDA